MGRQRTAVWALVGSLAGCGSGPGPVGPDVAHSSVSAVPTADTAGPVEVEVAPASARAGLDALSCLAPDGAALTWSRDGAPTGHTGPSVPALDVHPGTWRCEAVVEGGSGAAQATAAPVGGNLLVVLIDDIGLDKIGVYGMHDRPPPTPRIDQLAAEGVRFENAYATPMCSPTRAALLTGRLPGRTGVGHLVDAHTDRRWLVDEDTLPDVLARSPVGPYTSALTGKWHLANIADTHHPADLGFAVYRGSMNNPGLAVGNSGQKRGYDHWEKNTQGTLAFSDTYMTIDTIDDAVEQLATLPEPWFLYVPLNAAHEPWHVPPGELHTRALAPGASVRDKMDAMIEAVDTEIGRLVDAMTEAQRATTTIVVLGDNGTQEEVIREPLDPLRGKGTVYEGGVRVPLVVVSPHVEEPGRSSEALVHVVDLLPTAAALAGVDLDDGIPRDGLSLLPLLSEPEVAWPRRYLFTQKQRPNGFEPVSRSRTVRDERYKLLYSDVLGEEILSLYELTPGQLDEGPDLLTLGALTADQESAYDRLLAELQRIEEELAP